MKCPRCTASLRVYEQTTELSCYACGADLEVKREHCTIALRIIEEFSPPTDPVPLACTKREDLKTLQAEAEMLMTVKHVAGIMGLLCGGTFAYTGFEYMSSKDAAMGTCILVCAGAVLGTVLCISTPRRCAHN